MVRRRGQGWCCAQSLAGGLRKARFGRHSACTAAIRCWPICKMVDDLVGRRSTATSARE
jgi:hypothetical protein